MTSQPADPLGGGFVDSGELPKDVFAPSERDRIVQAMAGVCAERGYAHATVDEVVARAGVSRQAFDENFADKEECGLAAVNSIVTESIAVATAGYSPDASEQESILRGAKALLELMAARPSFADLAFIQARHAMPQRAFDAYSSSFQMLGSIIDRLRPYSPDEARRPATAARGALGGAEAMIRREIVAGRAEHLPELLPDIIYGALVPFLGQEEALRCARVARKLNDGG